MKNILLCAVTVLLLTGFPACREEEQPMEAAKIYLPLALRTDSDGVYPAVFDYDCDTTFLIAAYCSGSITPRNDIRVTLEPADDLLEQAAESNPALATYELLPESAYILTPGDLKLIIPKGKDRAGLHVEFRTTTLDPEKKYILPLRIAATSEYETAEGWDYLFFGITRK